jgi:hypothetical protein
VGWAGREVSLGNRREGIHTSREKPRRVLFFWRTVLSSPLPTRELELASSRGSEKSEMDLCGRL